MYADLKQLGGLKDKKVMAEFNKRQKELNALPTVDYEAVNKTKWEYFHLIFKQEGEKVLASDAFRNFYEANKEWVCENNNSPARVKRIWLPVRSKRGVLY